MKTRAGVLYHAGAGIEVTELELEPPGEQQVLVRIEASGVCHSDLSVIDGMVTAPLPAVLGHEAAGWVEDVGRGVTR
ncbi:MAG TPA: alcohol dehydrogenase catalytic domain-containing protein, partial [Acidimicrobiales bacterium]|nr:alcohol dehydrogenase catalytic domain-containing protein [Acidimicrobiales bacterium]